MNKEEKIAYLNKIIQSKDNYSYGGPAILYKYRSFNEYSFPMLERRTVYLSPATKLDDETECDVSFELSDFYEMKTNNLKRLCIDEILEYLRPYCSESVFEEIKYKVYRTMTPDGNIRRHFLLDLAGDIQDAAPGVDTAPLINWLGGIPEKFDDEKNKTQIEFLIGLANNAKNKLGICALGEEENNEDLWNRYGDQRRGYCIEYDVSNYELNKAIFPVVYDADREKSIVMILVKNILGQYIRGFTHNEIQPDISQFIRLFISKYPEWERQNEWRLLGDADVEIPGPKIKRIIIGRNVLKENKEKLIKWCDDNKIPYKLDE